MSKESHKFVAYYRVSTEEQGESGLGLEAQRKAVEDYLNGNGWEIVAEFVEVASGTDRERPKLEDAVRTARVYGATLIVSKLDRLARDAAFVLALQDAGVNIEFANAPGLSRFPVTMLAAAAEFEARMISERTREALAAAKRRGVELGTPDNLTDEARAKGRKQAAAVVSRRADQRAADLEPMIRQLQAEGATTPRELAERLNDKGVPTARGGQWYPTTVRRVLERLEQIEHEGALR